VYLQVGTEDEPLLIRRCLDGDASAFEPLVERYHRPLFRVAARMLGDREEARDVTQTAFLKAYVALPSCDSERRFFSWIYRIVVNECLNLLRARRPADDLSPALAAGDTPFDVAANGERARQVQQALLRLTPDARAVIVMRHFGELSYDEIAAALNLPSKTVKSRLYAARQRLGELLLGWGPES
jgi:RNA polymerase sigma-70 factor (ECF subfamily)